MYIFVSSIHVVWKPGDSGISISSITLLLMPWLFASPCIINNGTDCERSLSSKWRDSNTCTFLVLKNNRKYYYFFLFPEIISGWQVLPCNDDVIQGTTQINSSPPSAAYMCQWIGSALVQIMACRLFGDKPLSKPVLGFLSKGLLGTNFTEIWIEIQNFYSRKCIWKRHLRNSDHLSRERWVNTDWIASQQSIYYLLQTVGWRAEISMSLPTKTRLDRAKHTIAKITARWFIWQRGELI